MHRSTYKANLELLTAELPHLDNSGLHAVLVKHAPGAAAGSIALTSEKAREIAKKHLGI